MPPSVSRSRPPGWWRLLLADEALVMTGAQFREVALPVLMLSLWPDTRSYATALLASLVPQVALARWLGRLADRLPPKPVLLAAYALRMLGVAGLMAARSVPVALAGMVVLATGTVLALCAVSHYQAGADDAATRTLVSRLRAVAGGSQGLMPLAAGYVVAAAGRTAGFAVSLGCYGAAALVLAMLPARAATARAGGAGGRRAPTAPVPDPVRRQMMVVAAVNALAWIANALYTTYILLTLHAGAGGFGLALALWGGAGLASAALLPHVDIRRPHRVILLLIGVLAAAWLVMTRPVDFSVVALLGLPEGFATFALLDLMQARVLAEAEPAARGAWTAAARSWSAGGRVVGLAGASVLPIFDRLHLAFALLSALAVVLLCGWALGAPEPVPHGNATADPVHNGRRSHAADP